MRLFSPPQAHALIAERENALRRELEELSNQVIARIDELNRIKSEIKIVIDTKKDMIEKETKDLETARFSLKQIVDSLEARKREALKPIDDRLALVHSKEQAMEKSLFELGTKQSKFRQDESLIAMRKKDAQKELKNVRKMRDEMRRSLIKTKKLEDEQSSATRDVHGLQMKLSEGLKAIGIKEGQMEDEMVKMQKEQTKYFHMLQKKMDELTHERSLIADEREKLANAKEALKRTYGDSKKRREL